MNILADNYTLLKDRCRIVGDIVWCSKNYEDIFHDTIMYVSQDDKADGLSEEELLDFFCYRFKMLEFQTISDNKLERKVEYADYKKNNKETSEEN